MSATPMRGRGRRATWPSLGEWPGLLARAGKDAVADDVPMLASAMAFNAFLAIPAILLLVIGLFSLVADPDLIGEVMDKVSTVIPAEAVTLVDDSLRQLEQKPSSGILMTVVGFLLALWTTTGAVNTLMTAVNRAHELDDERGFVAKRGIAVLLVAALGLALLVVTAFLVLGPHIQRWIGNALDAERTVSWVWWSAQWPILLIVLFACFAVVFALAIDHPNRTWQLITPGALVTVVLWLVVSAGFAVYASQFGSYNKTWGSLSAAIVTMVWLWLSGLAVLFGAEVNAENERATREKEQRVSDNDERTRASQLRPAG